MVLGVAEDERAVHRVVEEKQEPSPFGGALLVLTHEGREDGA